MFVKGLIVAVVALSLALLAVVWTDVVAPGLTDSSESVETTTAPAPAPAPVFD